MQTASQITRLLTEWRAGNSDAAELLAPLVYPELRRLAEEAQRQAEAEAQERERARRRTLARATQSREAEALRGGSQGGLRGYEQFLRRREVGYQERRELRARLKEQERFQAEWEAQHLAQVAWERSQLRELELARAELERRVELEAERVMEAEALAQQAELVRRAERDKQPLAIEHRVDPGRSVTEVTIYTLDTHGLFARLAGAMAISGANIVDAKIFTLANGMALDTFWLQDLEGKPYDGPQRLARLAARVELSLSNRLDVRRELDSQKASWPKRDQVFTVEPLVLIDNNASDTFTVLEVNGRDRPGFLHIVTRALTRCSLQIASAHITTYGERAVDVFYVKDMFGLKVVNQEKLKQVADTVEQSIRDFDARFEPAVKAAE